MPDQDNKFSIRIEEKLKTQANLIKYLEEETIKAKLDYIRLQRTLGQEYKNSVVRRYMGLWQASDKLPRDPELDQVIFHLAGLEVEKIPKTELKFSRDTNNFTFTYFNEREQVWKELKP